MKGFEGARRLMALATLAAAGAAHGQAFTSQGLLVSVTYPTSLQFGPDERLYVSEQFGTVHAFTVVRDEDGQYASIAAEAIDLIAQVANHDDEGNLCTASECQQRQVTGLLATGSAAHPVLYVTSSDPRVAVASDSGLDTNSGLLTRLTCSGGVADGQCQQWDRVDLVRGLPRSEENHATNGMALSADGQTLYLAVGGNTNKGAISNSFSGTAETYLSAAILAIDLAQLQAIEAANGGAFVDPRDGTRFVYDLPTLDDPDRANITKTDPAFPYPVGHPWRERSVDIGDPFGGNDGRNQGVPEPGGPVRVHSAGYRNPYDVLVTASGEIYTWDNGANSGWGGTPLIYAANGTLKGWSTQAGVVFDPAAGDYCVNEINESGSATAGDSLHRITTPGYYGGHPAPIRAFPQRAGVWNYVQQESGHWLQSGPVHDFVALLPAGFGLDAADFPNDPRQCEYDVESTALEIVSASTNGLAEYTATNFGGAMQGDLLAASFNGNLYRCKPDGAGGLVDLPGPSTGTSEGACEVLLGGFGSQPLDVTAQGSGDIFPGTIWAATYGANSIVVFEPVDFACDPGVPTEDADGDGYSNGDEADNGTNACSAGSQPEDADKDFVSDLNDTDDDDDAVADVDDVFALDAANGTATPLPLHLPLFNNDPGTGLFGLGFTGLMLARDGGTTWREAFDATALAAGGTAGLLTVESVPSGTAAGAANTQRYAFQFGIDVDATTPPFVATTKLRPPWFEAGGGAGTPQPGQHYGLFVGTGDQDDYVAVTLAAGSSSTAVIEVAVEIDGTLTRTTHTASAWGGQNPLGASAIELGLVVDPQALTVQPRVAFDGSSTLHVLGTPRPIPADWLVAGDGRGFAVGAIASSGATASHFGATWDHFSVDHVAGGASGAWSLKAEFDDVRHEGGFVQAGAAFHLLGGRESNAVKRWDFASGTWSTRASSPIKLHHFQAVELDGLVYAAGAMTGECCSEPPAPNLYLYDPLADRWITGPAMPAGRARGGGGAAVVDGKLYLVSGNTNGHEGPVSAQVDVYDPATGRFTALAPIPHPRDHFFVAAKAGKLYAVGGRDSNAASDGDVFDDVVREVDVYDIATDTWSTLPASANLPTGRAAAATAIVGNELVVAGGESAASASAHAQTEVMDLATHTWRSAAPMRTPRHATQAAVSNHGFYVAGGSALRGGPDGPLDLDVLHLYGATQPEGTTLVAGTLQHATSLAFGRVGVGGERVLPLRLAHVGGNQAVVIDRLAFGGASGYSLRDAPALPFVLAPGATLDLQVVFAPPAQGLASATLDIGSPGRADLRTSLTGEGFGSANADVLYRVNVGGPAVAATDAPAPAWSVDTNASPSPYRSGAGGGETFSDVEGGAYPGAIVTTDPSLPPGLPVAIFRSERWDPPDAAEMRWEFPVASGTQVEVRLYFAELYSGIDNPGERVFDVRLEGTVPPDFDAIDRYAQAGAKGAILRSALATVSDGSVSLEFVHQLENPALNAIEILEVTGGVNAAPSARDDYASVALAGAVTIALLANDVDADGSLDASSIEVLDAPTEGMLEPGSGGQWIYRHDGGDHSGDSFRYRVRDDDGDWSNAATVRVRVAVPALAADVDGDGSANAADPDDDNDGHADTRDPLALDPANGLADSLPQRLALEPGLPPGGLFDLGFTGVLSNGRVGVRDGTDYAAAFDPARVFIDDRPQATHPFTLAAVDDGDATGATNTQTHGFQFGAAIDAATPTWVATTEVLAPFFDGAPVDGQSLGLQLGRGEQDNYLELALAADGSLRLLREEESATQLQTLSPAALLGAQRLRLMLMLDPSNATAQAMLAIDGGAPILVGTPVAIPASWLSSSDEWGLAIGLVATSAGPAPPFAAHWSMLEAVPLATDDAFAIAQASGSISLPVQANDAPASGRRIAALGTPDRGGSVSIDDRGTPADTRDDRVRYTPPPGAPQIETFTYRVEAAGGYAATATVTVTAAGAEFLFRDGFEGP